MTRGIRLGALIAFALIGPATSMFAAPQADREMGTLEFIKNRRDRQWPKVPRKILAFYYTWYGTPERQGRWIHYSGVDTERHEIASSTNYPAKGPYDSHDPAIIDYHLDLAKSCGVDAFICTWWGQGTYDDRAFEKVLARAEKKGIEATIYWETAPGKGEAQVARAVRDLLYVLKKYGSHPAFLKVQGRPVIFVYGRVMNQVELGEWPKIIRRTQRDYPKGFLLIADGYQEGYARMFDGIHVYNICGWVRGMSPETLREQSAKSFSDAVAMAKGRGKISCITIIPGYDDTKIRKPGIDAKRMDGQTYRILWEQAIAADPDWVLITSWNEWHEGSEIEPSFEHGEKYIDLTRTYARRFKKKRFSAVRAEAAPKGPSAKQIETLRRLYKGRTVGILPGYSGEAAFWLAETGVGVHELSWREVIDPARFTPGRFPVVLYGGYESYTQSLEADSDVDRALERYLREGGLLMALATGPLPFYLNEKQKAVGSAAKFGLPLRASTAKPRRSTGPDFQVTGWEKPPEGVRLAFEIDTERLPGLPRQVSFPAAGDLRWRPATRQALSGEAEYLPLVRLKDKDGHPYGDAVVCIQYKTQPLKNGKVIYAWMRMSDVLDANALFFHLFRLASQMQE